MVKFEGLLLNIYIATNRLIVQDEYGINMNRIENFLNDDSEVTIYLQVRFKDESVFRCWKNPYK